MATTFVYAHLNSRIMPMDRGARFEDALIEVLEKNGYGVVSGGGTSQSENGEIEYCGIDLDMSDMDRGIPFLIRAFDALGAPKGSKLQYEVAGEKVEKPFGVTEGLAVYLNGTDLPDEVYEECDINFVYDEMNRRFGERGQIESHWQGPTETALYSYGPSFAEMQSLIAPLLAEYPLCQKCRVVQIA